MVLVSGLPLAGGSRALPAPRAGKDRNHVMRVAAGAGEWLGSFRSMRVGVPDPVVALVQ